MNPVQIITSYYCKIHFDTNPLQVSHTTCAKNTWFFTSGDEYSVPSEVFCFIHYCKM